MEACRICGEADEELRQPCQCDGSMRYVHEACLMRWLEAKDRTHCEVCQTPFQFQDIYKPDAPERLSVKDVALGMADIVEKDLLSRAAKIYFWVVIFANVSAWLCLFLIQFVETGHVSLHLHLYGNRVFLYERILFPHYFLTPLGLVVCVQGLLFVHFWTSSLGPEEQDEPEPREGEQPATDISPVTRVLAGLYVNVVAALIGVVLPMCLTRMTRVAFGYASQSPVFKYAADDLLMWSVGVAPVFFYWISPFLRMGLLNAAPLCLTTAAFWHVCLSGVLRDHQTLYLVVTCVLTVLIVALPVKLCLALVGADLRPGGSRLGNILAGEVSSVENVHDCLLLSTLGVSSVLLALYPAISVLRKLEILPFVTASEGSRNSIQILFLHVLFPLLLRGPVIPVDGRRLGETLQSQSPAVRVFAFFAILSCGYCSFISVPLTLGRLTVSREDDALAFVAGIGLVYLAAHLRSFWSLVRTKLADFVSLIALAGYVLGLIPVVLGHGFFALTSSPQQWQSTGDPPILSVNGAWMTGLLVGKTVLIFAFIWVGQEEERLFLGFAEQPLDRRTHRRILQATAPVIRAYFLHVLLPTVAEYWSGRDDIVKIFTPVSVLGTVLYLHVFPRAIDTWKRFTKHVFDRRYLLRTRLIDYHKK